MVVAFPKSSKQTLPDKITANESSPIIRMLALSLKKSQILGGSVLRFAITIGVHLTVSCPIVWLAKIFWF